MTIKICKYKPCGKEFEIDSAGRKFCSHECSTAFHNDRNREHNRVARFPNAIYFARGIQQDNIHPNERGKDMSQHFGKFKIIDGVAYEAK